MEMAICISMKIKKLFNQLLFSSESITYPDIKNYRAISDTNIWCFKRFVFSSAFIKVSKFIIPQSGAYILPPP